MQKNQNNQVHGKQPGKANFQIQSLLPVGKENAISTKELVQLTGCSSARERRSFAKRYRIEQRIHFLL